MNIAITGATGKLGNLVVNHLISEGTNPSNIYAVVRNPEKAENLKEKGVKIVYGDYAKEESLLKALKSVNRLLLISGSEVGQRVAQHQSVVAAAKENGVSFIAYTSILNADKSHLILAQEHRETESLIKASGIPHSFLRNGWYTENYLEQIPTFLASGAILGAAKDGKFSAAPRSAFAQAAAKVLLKGESSKEIYELAGDYSFTLKELSDVLSKVARKEISYVDLSPSEYKDKLISFNVPAPFAEILADSDQKASNGELYSDSEDLKILNGESIDPLKELIQPYL